MHAPCIQDWPLHKNGGKKKNNATERPVMSPRKLAKTAIDVVRTPIFNLAIYLVVLSLVISSVAALGFAAMQSESKAYSEQQSIAISNTSKLVAQSVESLFKRVDVTLRSGASMVERTGMEKGNLKVFNHFLAEHRKLHPEVINLRVMDQNGDVLFGLEADEDQAMNLSDRPFYLAAKIQKQPELIVSGPVFARISKRWVLVLARRIEDGNQRFLGVIYANIDVERFSDLLTSPNLGKTGAVTLRNGEGYLIYRNPKPHNEVGTRNISQALEEIIKEGLPSGAYSSITKVDGVFRSNYYQKVGGFPVYVIVGSSQETPVEFERTRLIFILVLVLLSLSLVVLAGIFYFRKISQYQSNIDSRIELEKSLLSTQQSLQRAEEIAKLGNWVWDAQSDKVQWSTEMYAIFDVHKSAHIDFDTLREYFTETDWSRIKDFVGKCVGQGVSYSLDLQVVTKNGDEQWVNLQGAPYEIVNGEITKIHGTVQDITERKLLETRLSTAHSELADLYENAPCGYFSLDSEGKYIRINQTMLGWIGLPKEEVIGKMGPQDSLVGPEKESFPENFENLKKHGSISNERRQFISRLGDVRVMSLSVIAVYDESGAFQTTRSVMVDVTAEQTAQSALRKLLDEQNSILNNQTIGILKTVGNRSSWNNRSVLKIFGAISEDVLDFNFKGLYFSDEDYENSKAALAVQLQSNGVCRTQIKLKKLDGSEIWTDVQGILLDAKQNEVLWTFTDISSMKHEQEQLKFDLLHDQLTGIGNRTFLDSQASAIIARAQRNAESVAFCYLDLDGFKAVNDRYGHLAGDIVLKEVARRLQSTARAVDVVARLGGDEFALILSGLTDRTDHQAILNRWIHAIEQPMDIGGPSVSISASLGVAIYPADGDDPQRLFALADNRMYIEKKSHGLERAS